MARVRYLIEPESGRKVWTLIYYIRIVRFESPYSTPCNNGECIDRNNDFECDCSGIGFSGDDCQIADPCSVDPCVNEIALGGCINLSASDYMLETVQYFLPKIRVKRTEE